jgi:tetratricopeptide (TPR) repeat protein
MSNRTSLGAAARSAAGLAAILVVGSALSAYAQQQAPTGSDAATREAILKALSVQNLIGDAVSLSNQQYPEVDSAIKRFLNNDAAGAREFLELAKKKYPKLPPSDLTLAKMFVIIREGQRARLMLEQTVTQHPDDPEAYLLLADLAFAEGRTTEAHALFERAQTLTEKFTENEKRQRNFQIRVLAGLAAIHERRTQWAQAATLLEKWITIDPDSAVAHQRLGATLYRLEKSAEALEEFKKARQIDPNAANPLILMGQLNTQAGKLDEARKNFEAAYAGEPDNQTTARSFAEWLIQQNDLDKAQAVAKALRDKTPNSVDALLLDGVVAKMRGQSEAAEEAFMQVLALDPNNSYATNLLALVLSESKEPADLERALAHAQRNATLFPNSPQASITMAWVLYQMGRINEARQILGQRIQNPTADAMYLVARIMELEKQSDKAAALLDQTLKQMGAGVFMYRREAEAMLKRLIDSGVTIPQSGLPIEGAGTAPSGAAPDGASPTGSTPPISPTNPVGGGTP